VIANVDAGNEKVYQEALKLGVAAVAGLANPGERGTTYLFSHSVSNPINFVRYNAVFYLLDRLEIGDGIEGYCDLMEKNFEYVASLSQDVLDNVISMDEYRAAVNYELSPVAGAIPKPYSELAARLRYILFAIDRFCKY
jgi:sortase (surface protein transpeptidase)